MLHRELLLAPSEVDESRLQPGVAEEVLEREELIRMGLVEADGERRAQRVSVRADLGASGDTAHGLPDHLR